MLGVLSVVASVCVAVTASQSPASPAAASGPVAGTYRSIDPTRLLDTRIHLGATEPAPMGVVHLQVAGHGGIPATGVAAVALNVTVASPTRAGYITVYPDGENAPYASNLNFAAGETVPNLVIAKLGTNGVVDLRNASTGTTQLVADVSGYYLDGVASQPGSYTSLSPSRVLDTRVSNGATRIGAGSAARVQIAGRGGVPATGVSTAVLNVTVTRPAASGYLTVYADGHGRPGSSNLDFAAGETVPNLVFAPVGADGKVDFYNGASGATDLIADVAGYILGGPVSDPGAYITLSPTRLLDTRRKLGGSVLAGHATLPLTVAGRGGVPTGSLRAVVLNVTVTQPARYGYITAFPDGQVRQTASNLDFAAGETVPNLVVVPVGADGKVDLYNGSTAAVQLVADVAGYYLGTYGEPAASCAGFTDSTGITDSTITLANASDVSGPVPGLDLPAQQATEAYAAYFNSVSDICGRSLSVDALDTQTSSTGDQQAAATACTDAFAMVGSMSSFDDGGASTAAGCGIPDLRAATSEAQRLDAADAYAVSYPYIHSVPAAVPQYFVQHNATAAAHAAMLWISAGAWQVQGQDEMSGWANAGFTFVYHSGIDATAFNYATYVSAMQSAGVQYVQFVGPAQYAVRLAQAMQAQSFTPVFVVDPAAGTDPSYVTAGGAAVAGSYSFTDAALPTDTGNAELALYEHWLQVVAPGATPTATGIHAWSAALLFTQQAQALGGRLTRASLLSSLAHVSGWTGNGLQTAQSVGAKTPAPCAAVTTLTNGAWQRASAGQYACGSLIATGG